jgi:mannose-6-phosphate isomerase-like protein (cupin superfamily)
MRFPVFFLFLFSFSIAYSQTQTDLATIKPKDKFTHILSEPLNTDFNVSSFVIWINDEVKPHQHLTHSEYAVIIEGSGKMLLGDKTIDLHPGDLIYIPEKTVHALKVTSAEPMKVLSIQSAEFDGSDRVPVDIKW